MPERTPPEEAAVAMSIWQATDDVLLGRPETALARLEGDPAVLQHEAGLNFVGSLYLRAGRLDEALKVFDRAVALAPAFGQSYCNRGVVLQRAGRLNEALTNYDLAIECEPSDVAAHFSRGNVLNLLGRRREALLAYDQALRIDSKHIAARVNRGLVRLHEADLEGALSDFSDALLADPTNRLAEQGRGAAMRALGRPDKFPAPAIRPDERASNTDALVARANVLISMQRFEQALAVLKSVPNTSGSIGSAAFTAKSTALWKLGRRAEALAAGREAVRLDPSNARSREAFGHLCLKTGDFQRGWIENEFRLQRPQAQLRISRQNAPAWSGENLAGKRIVVLAEQGLGDTLQFVRYVSLLSDRGAAVTVVAQRPLVALLRSMSSPVEFVATQTLDAPVDFYIHLMSLPCIFGTKLETIPGGERYLSAEPERVRNWSLRIGTNGFRIGVAWQGNPSFFEDHLRSIPLATFAPLGESGARLISLQAVRGLQQMRLLPSGMVVEDLGEKVASNPDGFLEIAAAMESLDLVVTSDTAIAHLAGALGRPVWLALSNDPDWRWMEDRSNSPWYPTMRLFRQKTPGDWNRVFEEMREVLAPSIE